MQALARPLGPELVVFTNTPIIINNTAITTQARCLAVGVGERPLFVGCPREGGVASPSLTSVDRRPALGRPCLESKQERQQAAAASEEEGEG